MEIAEQDLHVTKTRFSAFFKTTLEDLLLRKNINKLIISGINTHACIRVTAIDAYMRDLEVIIPNDCVSSYDQEHHDITLNYLGKAVAKIINLRDI